jgi:succinate-acetate transporter protein
MNETKKVQIAAADPSALGLFGLAMVTLVASSQKLGWSTGVSGIIPWAIFLGASAQLFACINDSKHENTFGTTAFGAFAMFWYAVAATWLITTGFFGEALQSSFDPKQLGFAFIGYLIFSVFMTIGAMETHKVLFIIFVLIDGLFIGLTFSTFGIMKHEMHLFAGICELGVALFGFYGSAASVLNKHFGKVFLPVGKPFGIFK